MLRQGRTCIPMCTSARSRAAWLGGGHGVSRVPSHETLVVPRLPT